MGRSKQKPDDKENRIAALLAAKQAASAQLSAAKGVTSKVQWSAIAKQHGVDRTTLQQQPCDLRNPAAVTTYAQNPHRIGNADESGVQRCDGSASKLLAPTGA